MKNSKILGMTQVALLGAIIFVLAFTPGIGYIPLGVTRATIVHIPVIVGSVLLGPKKGGILGFLFGCTSFIINSFVTPTITSFTFTPLYNGGNMWSLVICFVPRILVGVVPYYVYTGLKALRKKFPSADSGKAGAVYNAFALAAAGLAGSLTNTLLVMNLIYFCFGKSYAAAKEITGSLYSVILGVIAVNGIPEAIVAAVLTAAIGGALLRFLQKRQPTAV
ncbi:MAG: ECF transporter S component [Oscillospiraceae bacterium]|jgi:uncharacterized membrane protein|nr:ECF transporter S component [Oscillospiraceae bacterium]